MELHQARTPQTPPTGHRRGRTGHFLAIARTEAFAGLPAGFSHPGQLLQNADSCGPALPFSSQALKLLRVLMDKSRAKDWHQGGRPIVWPTNSYLSDCLRLTPRQVQRRLDELEAAGAISRTTNEKGERIIDLSPLAQLGPEIRAIARRQDEERRERSALSHACNRAWSDVVMAESVILDADQPEDCARFAELRAAAAAAKPTGAARKSLATMRQRAATLKQLAAEATSMARRLAGVPEQGVQAPRPPGGQTDGQGCPAPRPPGGQTDGQGCPAPRPPGGQAEDQVASPSEENPAPIPPHMSPPRVPSRHITPTTKLLSDSESLTASGKVVRRDAVVALGGADRQPSAGPDLGSAIVLTPAPASLAELKRHLFGALPRFERIIADHLGHDPAIAGRVELLDAADVLRQEIGLRPAPWTQGIARHGWVHAVAAMVIAVARPAGEIIVSRAALLDGMLARDPAALHPWPSLHRIRKLPHEVDLDATPPAAPRPAAPIAPKLPFAPPPVAVAEAPPANIATAIAALAAMPSAERARWYQRAQPHLGRTVPGEWTQPARWAHAVTADLAAAGLLAGPARGPTPSDLAGP